MLFLAAPKKICLAQAEAVQPDQLKQHYDAADRYARAGDSDRAVAEYRLFLAGALHQIANGKAETGFFENAAPLFEEALTLSPDDKSLRLDYAQASLDAGKLPDARRLVEGVLRSDTRNTHARFLLGRVLYHLEDYNAAKTELEAAVAANPDFDAGYLLGKTYLILHDDKQAQTLFREMVAGLGDIALIHIFFGRAYTRMDYPDQAIEEFHKAIALDGRAPDAHYYLALAYLKHSETAGYAKAIPEFRAELQINPDDVRSHYMLGYIARKQRNFLDAEKELGAAAALQPKNMDSLLELAEVYSDMNRPAEAETALRKVIALAPANADNQVRARQAHYLLGRLLLRTGRLDEAKNEISITAEMEKRPGARTETDAEARTISSGSLAQQETPLNSDQTAAKSSSSAEVQQAEDFKNRLSPAIAEVYNNLGVISAGKHDFIAASEFFERAATWNSQLGGLDRNRGMAAFYAEKFEKAVPPLERFMAVHPVDAAASSVLAEAYFRVGKRQLETGTIEPAILSLKNAVRIAPARAEVHEELSRAYRLAGRAPEADREMKLYETLKEKAPGSDAPK
jgi:tetratricopeptide (TPR) repeat protein